MGCAASQDGVVHSTTVGNYPTQGGNRNQGYSQNVGRQNAPPYSSPPPPYQQEVPKSQPDPNEPKAYQKKLGAGESAITEEVLNRYLHLDQILQTKFSEALLYKTHDKDLTDLKTRYGEMQQHYEVLKAKTIKEHQDVIDISKNVSVRYMIEAQGKSLEEAFSEEEQEYLEALNKQEMYETELNGVKDRITNLESQVLESKKVYDEVNAAQDEQDSILENIFSGDYGSETEMRLENELDIAMEQRSRIANADFKWRKARKFLYYAIIQMYEGLKHWINLPRVPYHPQNMNLRYRVVSEARNNFSAASQNFAVMHATIPHIQLPYCTPSEVSTMNLALHHIYTDMMTNQRYQHAFSCYNAVYRRALPLLQWVDKVIVDVITNDLSSISNTTVEKAKALRQERAILIAQKIQEVLGKEIDISALAKSADQAAAMYALQPANTDSIHVYEPGKQDASSDLNSEINQAAASTQNVEDVSDTVKAEGGVPMAIEQSQADEVLKMQQPDKEPPRKSLKDLAPAPQSSEIFGNLQNQLDSNIKHIEKTQSMQRAKMRGDLEAKLAQRRARRQAAQ